MNSSRYHITIILILFSTILKSQQKLFLGGSLPCGAQGSFIFSSKVSDSNHNTYFVGTFAANTSYTAPVFKLLQSPNSYTDLGKADGFLIKVNNKGEILWHSIIQGSGQDTYISVKLDANENPIVCGYASNSTSPITTTITNNSQIYTINPSYSSQPFLAKFDKSSGSVIKFQFLTSIDGLGTSVNSRPDAMNICGDKIIIVGSFKGTGILINNMPTGNNGTTFDLYLISTDLNFNIDNFKIFKRSASTAIASNINFIQKNNDGYFFSGTLYDGSVTFPVSSGNRTISSTSSSYYDFFVYKTDNNFNGQWVVKSLGVTNNYDKQITQTYIDASDNLGIVGNNKSGSFSVEKIISNTPVSAGSFNNFSPSGNVSDIFLFKYSNVGDLVDSKIIGNTNDQGCSDVFQFDDKIVLSGSFKNLFIIGKDTLKTYGSTNQDSYMAVINKTDYSGIGAIQFRGNGVETGDAVFYNNLNYNLLLGTTTSLSDTIQTATDNIFLINNSPKSIYVANACPIIGIFETPTSNIIYNPATTTTGSIALDVKGDVFRGYSYNWIKAGDASWSATTSSISNLAKGDYKVTVNYLTDQCSKSRAFSVRPAIEEISVNNVSGSCNTNNSSITAKAKRYLPNGSLIQFSIDSLNWNDGTLVVSSDSTYSYTFSSLYAGNYSLYYRIKTKSDYIILKGSLVSIVPTPTTISNLSLSVTPTGCKGESNGAITVNAKIADGGTLSYYNIAAGTTYPSNPYKGLSAGSSYDVYVQNSTGCIAHAGTVNFPAVTSALTASASACYVSTEPTSNTAGIKLSATGGLAPYAYSLSQGLSVIPEMSPGTFAGLSYGTTYDYVVTDVSGCSTSTTSYKIGDFGSSLFKVDVTTNNILCSDNNVRGELIATPTGGVTPYSYYFDYGKGTYGLAENIGDWGNLSTGTYNIKVDDAAGCEVITTKTLSPVIPMPTPFYTKN